MHSLHSHHRSGISARRAPLALAFACTLAFATGLLPWAQSAAASSATRTGAPSAQGADTTSRRAPDPFAVPGEPVVVGRGYDVPSVVLGDVRRINVLLPPAYDDPKARDVRYPVLYLLDGGAGWQDFVHVAAIAQQGGTWGANAPLIVVGIESRDRKREFLTPSSDPKERADFPTHGEAERFRRFVVEELKPAVNAAFRTDGVDGLIGESLAGYFVVDTALRHPGDFDRYVAVSPSLWWDRESLSRRAADLLAQDRTPRTLWLSIADEGGTMQGAMDRVVAALRSAGSSSGIAWTYALFPKESHTTIYHPAATRAIRDVFPPAVGAR
jgi:predicted alpha/beta superfamily hydrolase